MNPDTLLDADTERALLGCCLISDVAIERAAGMLTPGDFGVSRHREIFAAILDQHATGNGRVDPITVAAAITGDGALQYLVELQNATYSVSNTERYATTIADLKLRRTLIHATDDIARWAKDEGDAGEAAERARELLANLDMPTSQGAPDPDVDSFIAASPTAYDWLVPDLLERRDRMLVTAGEGSGKSVLLAQIAVQVAAGIHPWTLAPVEPRNVTVIDLENSERLVARRFGWLRKAVKQSWNPQRLRIHTRPGGIDLTTRVDRRWLIDRCRANAAELLVIGPAYRMQAGAAERGDIGGEDQTRSVTRALDDIRNRCDVALLMETHAPHGNGMGRDLRPFGSSMWLRWPEFGIGIRRSSPDPADENRYLVEHWRGPRDQRMWPEELHKHAGPWPWTPQLPTRAYRRPA